MNDKDIVKLDNTDRETFNSKYGFILACVGSAVGMGNIWLFPYRVGQFGGFAFLIPYWIWIIILGFCGVTGEMAFGRAMQSGPVGAFKKSMERRGKKHGDIIGLIPVFGSLGVGIGYAVVVGWIIRFLVGSATGALVNAQDSGAYFGEIAGSFGSVSWHIIALVLTFVIMNAGISAGIEKVNKVLMPLFFVLFAVLAIRVAFLPGAVNGYRFMFNPDWSALKNPKAWIYALGQAFFSLSIGGSGTVVYGSYLKKDVDVIYSAKYIAIFDTIAAMLSSLVIIPAVFAFNMNPGSGPPLMFITMPEIFKRMPAGSLFSTIFFIAVFFAGITSLVNLFETPIEALQSKFKFSRIKAVSVIAAIATCVGLLIENGDVIGVWMDFVSINIIPLGAIAAAIMFYWVCGRGFATEQIQMGREKKVWPWLEPLGRYVFCGVSIFVYIAGILLGGIG
ncbi:MULTISPECIES: sodium-dependent transporter [Clostridium]|uniref:Sodium:neurotransmitter symporter family protein n=2 Tax=Clostridium TaxID=1485 RepID=A0A151AKD5_9CLOT|nr:MULTISPECIES: sodium-dependent transporter [Clostridium]KYH28094.1 sodium:neurotransmitter symporter family protein [Clostridium colicanis DSM 13634]MBE6043041.1 sodium-dependent transporter [Clostridium thermopalmarium]PRR71560.1 Sodium:neurotransmitter symporter family protein [Clostridium thermopalmarium DSM 5974]PVZ20975.1 NSS family neurotransmitter:Na+ symporter [Clostridium thermopalmarium DSM 5974]